MNVHLSYKASKTPEVEREFQHQIEKLQKRLHVFKPDLIHLHAIIEPVNGRSTVVSLNLRLPSGQMTAQKPGERPLTAVKGAFADLVAQLTKHKELLRGQWTGKSRRSAREQGAANAAAAPAVFAVPAPEASRVPAGPEAPGDVAHWVSADWVSANMERVQRFVTHELRTRVLAGQIREDQISAEEVIDEVMVSALSQDQEQDARADWLPRESWFHRLAMLAIRRLVHSNADTAAVSLDSSAGTQNVTGSDENSLQFHQPDDSTSEESVIRDRSARTPEEIFASEEMVAQLNLVLLGLGPQDREAFVLYTLEGFTVDEIARLSDRAPDLVRQSIHHARERVQRKLPEQNEFRRSLLGRSRVA
ncbi:MAG: sigma-70 family RNA polymerase sigma factor [Acidobacteriia bacterium]|nr:sigma-70 family RNA polymerase sigma factor [Terriglobia bacterium]